MSICIFSLFREKEKYLYRSFTEMHRGKQNGQRRRDKGKKMTKDKESDYYISG